MVEEGLGGGVCMLHGLPLVIYYTSISHYKNLEFLANVPDPSQPPTYTISHTSFPLTYSKIILESNLHIHYTPILPVHMVDAGKSTFLWETDGYWIGFGSCEMGARSWGGIG